MRADYDVVIVGAGLVGLVLASLLGRADLSVAVIETGQINKIDLDPNHYQLRVSAINLAVKEMFNDLDVWDEILNSNRLSAYERMEVWDSLGRGKIIFDSTEIAKPCLGYVIENAVMNNALLQELKQYPSVSLLSNCKPIELGMSEKTIEIRISHHQDSATKSLRSKLLVGADGAKSWVRQQSNIQNFSWPYHHHALVTTVKTEYSHQKTAWQCFLPEGPLALLPLFDKHTCSIVWSASPDYIASLLQATDRGFDLEISSAFEYKLGNIKKIGPLQTIPLQMQHAKTYINKRIALIGDAAHTFHPLAGQGVNIGFADAVSLAQTIISASLANQDFGDYRVLRKYERERKSDNWLMIFGMEFFKRLFQKSSLPIISLRSLGLEGVNKLQLLKNQFIYKAIGDSF